MFEDWNLLVSIFFLILNAFKSVLISTFVKDFCIKSAFSNFFCIKRVFSEISAWRMRSMKFLHQKYVQYIFCIKCAFSKFFEIKRFTLKKIVMNSQTFLVLNLITKCPNKSSEIKTFPIFTKKSNLK